MKRCSSIHVGSRWYRAPEISLVEKQYDQGIDMWSMGCITFELLQYLHRPADVSMKEFQKLRYLFQGTSCFPLSPCNKNKAKVNIIGTHDQVKVILGGLGRQTDEDLSFISSDNAVNYVRELERACEGSNQRSNSLDKIQSGQKTPFFQEKCQNFKAHMLPKYSELVELLRNLLSFNPFFRHTALEALRLKIFDSVRSAHKERVLQQMHAQLTKKPVSSQVRELDSLDSNLVLLSVDAADAFDYENSENAKYSVTDLKHILSQEILQVQMDLAEKRLRQQKAS